MRRSAVQRLLTMLDARVLSNGCICVATETGGAAAAAVTDAALLCALDSVCNESSSALLAVSVGQKHAGAGNDACRSASARALEEYLVPALRGALLAELPSATGPTRHNTQTVVSPAMTAPVKASKLPQRPMVILLEAAAAIVAVAEGNNSQLQFYADAWIIQAQDIVAAWDNYRVDGNNRMGEPERSDFYKARLTRGTSSALLVSGRANILLRSPASSPSATSKLGDVAGVMTGKQDALFVSTTEEDHVSSPLSSAGSSTSSGSATFPSGELHGTVLRGASSGEAVFGFPITSSLHRIRTPYPQQLSRSVAALKEEDISQTITHSAVDSAVAVSSSRSAPAGTSSQLTVENQSFVTSQSCRSSVDPGSTVDGTPRPSLLMNGFEAFHTDTDVAESQLKRLSLGHSDADANRMRYRRLLPPPTDAGPALRRGGSLKNMSGFRS